jgi:NhaA family Na+:H+ antiporter
MAGATPARNATPAPIRFLFENSLFLISGAIAALLWANLDPTHQIEQGTVVHGSYDRFIHFDLEAFARDLFGGPHAGAADASHGHEEAGHPKFTLHFLINDVLMALFFAIAAKEVWESLLPGGALSNPRKAMTPLLATAGGVIGPAAIYAGGALALGHWDTLGRGWAVPCATDIAFSYLFARMIFGVGHPAIAFLLLLAIADDAAGLVILAVFYPSGELHLTWLLATLAAIALGLVFHKVLRLHSFWWYLLIPGVISWWSFFKAGIHPALGLVPIIPFMPHAHTDLGIFAREELGRHDTLSEFEHAWKYPVELILGLFGLVNAGVVLSSIGVGTWLVFCGLLIGKPVGITLLTWIAEKVLRLEIPGGMGYRHIITLGAVAGIGFTVALFVSTAAFPTPGAIQDSVKMGSLMSFGAAVLAFVLAKLLGVKPVKAAPVAEVSA